MLTGGPNRQCDGSAVALQHSLQAHVFRYAGAPNGSWLLPDFWVFLMRCFLHTVIRVVAYVLGPLVPGDSNL